MNCECCTQKMIDKRSFKAKSKIIGDVYVATKGSYRYCSICDESLISMEVAQEINDEVKKKEQSAIGELPISSFVSITVAVKILGITKQAFSKNHRIKKGFIMSFDLEGRKLFSKKSVELFANFKDGRFSIKESKDEVHIFHTAKGNENVINVKPYYDSGYYIVGREDSLIENHTSSMKTSFIPSIDGSSSIVQDFEEA